MKFLVDRTTNNVQGRYLNNPTNMDFSGLNVINVPFDGFEFNSSPPILANLLSQKTSFINDYVNNIFVYTASVSSDFISAVPVNSTYSYLYRTGPNKRYSIKPNGYICIGSFPAGYNFALSPVEFFCDYSAYIESFPSSGILPFGAPYKAINFGFNPFTDITFTLVDSLGVTLQTLSPGQSISTTTYTGDFFVLLTNNTSQTLTLSDFCLYWRY